MQMQRVPRAQSAQRALLASIISSLVFVLAACTESDDSNKPAASSSPVASGDIKSGSDKKSDQSPRLIGAGDISGVWVADYEATVAHLKKNQQPVKRAERLKKEVASMTFTGGKLEAENKKMPYMHLVDQKGRCYLMVDGKNKYPYRFLTEDRLLFGDEKYQIVLQRKSAGDEPSMASEKMMDKAIAFSNQLRGTNWFSGDDMLFFREVEGQFFEISGRISRLHSSQILVMSSHSANYIALKYIGTSPEELTFTDETLVKGSSSAYKKLDDAAMKPLVQTVARAIYKNAPHYLAVNRSLELQGRMLVASPQLPGRTVMNYGSQQKLVNAFKNANQGAKVMGIQYMKKDPVTREKGADGKNSKPTLQVLAEMTNGRYLFTKNTDF